MKKTETFARVAVFACAILIAMLGNAYAGVPVYVYPPIYKLKDGRIFRGPQTFYLNQITTSIPNISQIQGVALTVYWSMMCPSNACQFSLIDKTLEYWGRRNKKVILLVATVGDPVRFERGGRVSIVQGATPSWVLREVPTYSSEAPILGIPDVFDSRYKFQMPSYASEKFILMVGDLANELAARYDGNPAIKAIRIPIGVTGEEVPSAGDRIVRGRLICPIPGWSPSEWLAYITKVSKEYVSAFKKTKLQFDLSAIGWIYPEAAPKVRGQIDEFLGWLKRKGVILGYNGLSSISARAYLESLKKRALPGPATSLNLLARYEASGGEIALEAIGPPFDPAMQDVSIILRLVQSLRPVSVVLFGPTVTVFTHFKNGRFHDPGPIFKATVPKKYGAQKAQDVRTMLKRLGEMR